MSRWGWGMLVLAALLPGLARAATFTEVGYAGDDGGPALQAGQFRNPILAGFYPDPSMVRVGDDFYLVNSTFGYFPGLPVFHSRDLVNWEQLGNAIDRPGQINYGPDELTRGLFAASISYHDGTFYIANTCFYCDGGNFLVTASEPAGPWSDPIWLGFEGIDPSLFFDDDGSAWMVNNGIPAVEMRYDGHRAIWLQQYDVAARRMIGPRTVLVDGGADPDSRPEHVEGPHLFKRDGYYYLTAAEGGTGEQHAQMIWRSRQVTGPYVPWQGNPILTQRDLDPARPNPVTSAGHAQLVELKDGSWWSVFLATRPYRGNQYNLGRETFLLPVQWHDGWPQVLPHGQPIPQVLARPALANAPVASPMTGAFGWSERFNADHLPPQWLSIHPPATPWFATGPGGLKLTPSATPLGGQGKDGQPSYLGHRLQHHHATLTATLLPESLEAGEFAGLAVFQNEGHHYAVGLQAGDAGTEVVLYARTGNDQPAAGQVLARTRLSASSRQPVSLRFQLDGPKLQVAYATQAGQWTTLASDLDASVLSTDVAGGFIGATFGPYAYRH